MFDLIKLPEDNMETEQETKPAETKETKKEKKQKKQVDADLDTHMEDLLE